jgi:hypothetical protein
MRIGTKYSQEYVDSYIRDRGYILISEYKNCKMRIEIMCGCKKSWFVTFKTLKNHGNFPCEVCSNRKTRLGMYNFEDAKRYVEIESNSGCKFLSDSYYGIYEIYDFLCPCGEKFSTKLSLFKHENHTLCDKCMKNRRRGKGKYINERDKFKFSEEYKQWRKCVFERDGYRCVCCGNNKYLVAHHIENFATFPEKRADVDNGITLCDGCHNFNKYGSFHYIYGSKNNNPQQLDEYIERYQKGAFQVIKLANLIK